MRNARENLLLGGNHGSDALETCIGKNPFVFGVGDGSPHAAPSDFPGQGYGVGNCVARLEQILAVVFIRYPGSRFGGTSLCHRIILVEFPVGIETCPVCATRSAGACVAAVFRFSVGVVWLALIDGPCRTDVTRQSLSEFILIIRPPHHIVYAEVTAIRYADTFGCAGSRFRSHS